MTVTARDHIAATIAAAMLVHLNTHYSNPGASIGRDAYKFADAMLQERDAIDAAKIDEDIKTQ